MKARHFFWLKIRFVLNFYLSACAFKHTGDGLKLNLRQQKEKEK